MYSIVETHQNEEVVLKKNKAVTIAIAILLILLGVPSALFGIIFENSIALSFGAFLTCAASVVISSRLYPEKFIFDNTHALLHIIERDGEKYSIPYSEIHDFRVGLDQRKKTTFFTVEMRKKDGSIWAFAMFANRKRAEEMVTALQNKVFLQKHSPNLSYPEALPTLKNIRTSHKNGTYIIQWKQRHSFVSFLGGYGAIFSFAMLLWNLANTFKENIVGRIFAYGFGIIIVGISILYLTYSINRIYVLEIGNELLHYYTKGLWGKGFAFDLPIYQIDSILVNMPINRAEMVIYFLSREQHERFFAMWHGEAKIENILETITFMSNLPRIDTGGFTLTEKLKLKKIIQNALSQFCTQQNI